MAGLCQVYVSWGDGQNHGNFNVFYGPSYLGPLLLQRNNGQTLNLHVDSDAYLLSTYPSATVLATLHTFQQGMHEYRYLVRTFHTFF